MMAHGLVATVLLGPQTQVSFPQGAIANEEMVLRWMHIVAGITWIGLLYYFNLILGPWMKELDAGTRAKVLTGMMSRAMGWFRWSAVVTVVAGLRYFMILLAADAHNAGDPGLEWRWLGYWFLTWVVAYALIYALQLPMKGAMKGALDNGWVRAVPIAAVVVAAAWVVLQLNANPQSSNSHLSISVGGGLGLVLLLNVWGVVWRAQKRLIAFHRAYAENGAPIPPEAARLARWAFLASRTGFWLSFPMLFFMGAAEHYPFLSGILN
jgi:uncharacterized membrane protein